MEELLDIEIPEGTTEINESTIENHTTVRSVKIPSSVLVIAKNAFADCINLTSINLPKGLMAIGEYAFLNCVNIDSIEIPEGIRVIEKGCFKGCAHIESFILPESITTIRDEAFDGCTGIKNLVVPNNLTCCTSSAFPNSKTYLPVNKVYKYENNMMINTNNHILLFFDGKREKVRTPDYVRGIGNRAFYGTNISIVKITDNITSIGEEAFANCNKKVQILIPESVDYIERNAFDDNCELLCAKNSYAEDWCENSNYKKISDVEM